MSRPTPLWEPAPGRDSRLRRLLDEKGFGTYDELWRWSVTDPAFWADVVDRLALPVRGVGEVLVEDASAVTGARWYPGATVNYAEAALTAGGSVVGVSQTRPDVELGPAALRDLVGRVRAGLVAAGVGRGDCVAGYLPNIPETLAVLLASASLGATWTCCAPEMGVAGTLDRLTQARPVALVAVDGYRYGSRPVDRREDAAAIRAGLPSLRAAVMLPYLGDGAAEGWTPWEAFTAEAGPVEFEPVAFDHPLYALFSSGTTGKPKAILHGHGGITVEHAKALAYHFDLGGDDRFFWYSTTGWMMWNFLVSGLLVGATVVMYDGEPSDLWGLMATQQVSCGGVGAGFLVNAMKAGATPVVPALRTLGSTGSPLPPAAAEWVYNEVSADVLLASFSGGTDVCTGFVGASPLHPVWAGEISCRCLGASVEVLDDDGRPVVGREGELVLTRPLPSMPVAFLGDTDGSRYHAAYFERFPGIWAHGDRATLTDRGSVVITGRSDGTFNRGGVRMGTAEFYDVVEGFAEVTDSLVVHLEDPDGGPGRLMLFVVPVSGVLDEDLRARIAAALRRDLSPRHVPDVIEAVAAVPRTLSGKKLEVPVKKILSGVEPAAAVTLASVADPSTLDPFINRYQPG